MIKLSNNKKNIMTNLISPLKINLEASSSPRLRDAGDKELRPAFKNLVNTPKPSKDSEENGIAVNGKIQSSEIIDKELEKSQDNLSFLNLFIIEPNTQSKEMISKRDEQKLLIGDALKEKDYRLSKEVKVTEDLLRGSKEKIDQESLALGQKSVSNFSATSNIEMSLGLESSTQTTVAIQNEVLLKSPEVWRMQSLVLEAINTFREKAVDTELKGERLGSESETINNIEREGSVGGSSRLSAQEQVLPTFKLSFDNGIMSVNVGLNNWEEIRQMNENKNVLIEELEQQDFGFGVEVKLSLNESAKFGSQEDFSRTERNQKSYSEEQDASLIEIRPEIKSDIYWRC